MTKMTAMLNIGLNWTDKGGAERQHDLNTAINALTERGVKVLQTSTVQSDSEPTLVVRCLVDRDCYDVYAASAELSQYCIAVWSIEDQRGLLIGPDADKWGAFDPDYFFCQDGTRLGDQPEED